MQGFLMSIAFGGGRTVQVRAALQRTLAAMQEVANHRLCDVVPAPASVDACFVFEADGILDDHLGAASDEQRFVICYGEVDDRFGSASERLLAAFRDKGLAGLGSVHGCFGAVIVDRATGNTIIFGDGLGQRNLRHCWLEDRLLVATHDIFLVGAGVAVRPANVALASVLRFGWSFGDESLIEGIATVGSEQVTLIAADRTVSRRSHPAHDQAAVKRASGVDVAEVRETIVNELASYVRVNRRIGTPLDVELSAGFDSRAVISLAHHAARKDVRAFTDGPPASQDSRVARKVAAVLDIPHRAGGTAHNTAASRLAYVRALALATNGQGTALVAMTSSERRLADAPDSLGGDGGEIFRGYYYPKLGRGEQAVFDLGKLAEFVMGKFTVGARMLDPGQEAALRKAVERRLMRLAPHCDLMADGYDLVYLIERTGTWNQKLRRFTEADRRRNPFYSRAATYAFLALPGARAESRASMKRS
jgi:asparagine synthetase B (glutamine-hydrolysing)